METQSDLRRYRFSHCGLDDRLSAGHSVRCGVLGEVSGDDAVHADLHGGDDTHGSAKEIRDAPRIVDDHRHVHTVHADHYHGHGACVRSPVHVVVIGSESCIA